MNNQLDLTSVRSRVNVNMAFSVYQSIMRRTIYPVIIDIHDIGVWPVFKRIRHTISDEVHEL